MLQKMKRLGSYLLIIVLLPYIITVFLNGPAVTTSANVDEGYIMVENEGKETEMSIVTANWFTDFRKRSFCATDRA